MKKRLIGLSAMMVVSLLSVGCNKEMGAKSEPQQVVKEESNVEESTTTESKEAEVAKTEETTEETASTGGASGALPTKILDANQLVTEAFTKEDPYFDFKVKYTQEFLDKTMIMLGVLDERYTPEYEDDTAFYVNEDSSSFRYQREVENYDEQYKYIKSIKYTLGFSDAKDDLYGAQGLQLTLCDEDKDGKIELNDKTSLILKTFYPDADLKIVQEKIDAAVAAEKSQNYEGIYYDADEKYYNWMSFSWFRYEDNPVEVSISMDNFSDYPVK